MDKNLKFRPQVLAAILAIAMLGILVIIFTPDYVDKIVGGAITGVGMLGMKLLEGE
jgi:hypothetical protein|tara:strand:+ start:5965 stop:6132 length:168 start_codon:yes stop_codon:yes gene_type:complete